MNSTSIERTFRWIAIALVGAAALLGINSLGSLSPRWLALGLVLHLLPAAMQVPRALRAPGAWLAVLLITQALLSFLLSSSDTHLLEPNLRRVTRLAEGTVLGISGEQVLTTDGMGFRVTRPISYGAKPPESLRILAIGGSTTEQSLLDDRRTWTHLLQEELQAHFADRVVEVINAGSSGTRAEHHLVTLRETSAVRADLVLILMGINDWNKHIREHYGSKVYGPLGDALWKLRLENTILGRAIRRGSDAAQRREGGPEPDAMAMTGVEASLSRSDQRTLEIGSVAADYAAVVEKIIDECRRQRTNCVFLTQPTAYRGAASPALRSRFWMTPPFEEYTLDLESLAAIADTYNRYLLQVAAARGMAACDTATKMESMPDGFYDDCHFNEAGARVMAASIAQCLLERGAFARQVDR